MRGAPESFLMIIFDPSFLSVTGPHAFTLAQLSCQLPTATLQRAHNRTRARNFQRNGIVFLCFRGKKNIHLWSFGRLQAALVVHLYD